MIEQILNYLPIIGVLGLFWGIIQFYQKRSYVKSDLKREIKRSSYKEVDLILNDIKNEYWLLFAMISQNSLSYRKKDNYFDQQLDLTEFDLNEQNTKFSERELIYSQEIKTSIKILENIEIEGFDEDKHKSIVKEQIKLTKKRQKELKSSLKDSLQKLENIKTRHNELSKFLDIQDQKISDKIKETSESLQNFILILNKISLVGIDEKYILKSLIFNLTKSIQTLIDQLKTEENISIKRIIEVLDMDNIQETMKIVSKIELHINFDKT
jgi:hypothetical protein